MKKNKKTLKCENIFTFIRFLILSIAFLVAGISSLLRGEAFCIFLFSLSIFMGSLAYSASPHFVSEADNTEKKQPPQEETQANETEKPLVEQPEIEEKTKDFSPEDLNNYITIPDYDELYKTYIPPVDPNSIPRPEPGYNDYSENILIPTQSKPHNVNKNSIQKKTNSKPKKSTKTEFISISIIPSPEKGRILKFFNNNIPTDELSVTDARILWKAFDEYEEMNITKISENQYRLKNFYTVESNSCECWYFKSKNKDKEKTQPKTRCKHILALSLYKGEITDNKEKLEKHVLELAEKYPTIKK